MGSFESQIKSGRTAMDMPTYPIAPLSRTVVGCNTGPYGGLCQLDPDLNHPTHDRGESLLRGYWVPESEFESGITIHM